MPRRPLSDLEALARRHARRPEEADDLLQEALLVAVEAGRTDLSSPETRRWLQGVMRNQSRMAARTAVRRRRRETEWSRAEAGSIAPPIETAAAGRAAPGEMAALPPALRLVALLALNGATREELRWLLGVSDAALRQRLSQLKRALATRGIDPGSLQGPRHESLVFGQIRRALLPAMRRDGAVLASHDPDGNLFVVTRSQIASLRQQTHG